ncbi:MAG TPA: hypothetical protein VGO92_12480 [Acidimicrobiales bacterium]|jgi:hypothetical protein|nr:hypothetical protein [Acidimicrobiales bacterium]
MAIETADAADTAAPIQATALPRGAAYMEALQDPAAAFADPDLAQAQPVLTPLGLPRPVSGNFASVFRLDGPDGRSHAVRCFVRGFDDMARRYAAIDQHLRRLPPASTWRVGFEYQEHGVQVQGEWFPIVKMDWASGQPLLAYIEQHLWDGPALAYLATRFATLVDELRRSGVAHGDLQHGNILVAPGGDLRLIDYDGMFVPPLAGLPGNELGHRNYQHPGRSPGEFGLHLDNFASWVVYASLVGLSVDPLLWGRLDGGDECLLFRSHDFADPAHSEALAAFEATGEPVLRDLAGRLRHYLDTPFDAVPPLSPDKAPLPTLPEDRPVDNQRQRSLMAALREDGPGAGRSAAVETVRPRHTAPPSQVHFTHMGAAQAVFAAAFGGAVIAIGLAVIGLLAALAALPLIGAAAVAAGRSLWQRSPEVAEYRSKQASHHRAERKRDEAQGTVERLQRDRAAVDRVEQDALARAGRAQEDQQTGRDAAIREIDDGLRARLTELAAQEQELYRDEHTALAAALRDRQRAVIDDDLGRKPLSMYSGLDDRLLYALALDDVRTAADFVDVAVEGDVSHLVRADGRRVRATGLPPQKAHQLLSWRRSLEARLTASLPTALSDDDAASIRARFADRRGALAGAEQAARADAARQAEAVRAMPLADTTSLTEAARQAQRDAAARRVKLDQELNRARKGLAEAVWELDEAAWALDAFSDLTFAAYAKAVFALGFKR